jgi:hypothetical protein
MNQKLLKMLQDVWTKEEGPTNESRLMLIKDMYRIFEKFAEAVAEDCASIAYNSSDDGDVSASAILYEYNVHSARNHK